VYTCLVFIWAYCTRAVGVNSKLYSKPTRYCTVQYQWLRWGFDPFIHLTALEEAKIIPGKHSDTRTKPLTLTNDHGRYIVYIAVTPERALESVGEYGISVKYMTVKFLAVSLLKPPFGGFRSETATWIQKWFKKSVGASRKFYIICNSFSRRRRWAWL
jgi:hypothetical protein